MNYLNMNGFIYITKISQDNMGNSIETIEMQLGICNNKKMLNKVLMN